MLLAELCRLAVCTRRAVPPTACRVSAFRVATGVLCALQPKRASLLVAPSGNGVACTECTEFGAGWIALALLMLTDGRGVLGAGGARNAGGTSTTHADGGLAGAAHATRNLFCLRCDCDVYVTPLAAFFGF